MMESGGRHCAGCTRRMRENDTLVVRGWARWYKPTYVDTKYHSPIRRSRPAAEYPSPRQNPHHNFLHAQFSHSLTIASSSAGLCSRVV
jgi:hypothetical protein